MTRFFSLVLGLATLSAAPAAFAYHSQVGLWELTRRSNLIVVAIVLSHAAEEGRASLLLVEKLRVPAEGVDSEVEVSYDPLYPCGRPSFLPGRRVLAFLRVAGDQVRATNFEESTRYATDLEVDHLRRLILDAMDQQLATSSNSQRLVSWFGDAWDGPESRWDAEMLAMELLVDPTMKSAHRPLRASLRTRCGGRDGDACAILGFDRAHLGDRDAATRFWERACRLGHGISCLALGVAR